MCFFDHNYNLHRPSCRKPLQFDSPTSIFIQIRAINSFSVPQHIEYLLNRNVSLNHSLFSMRMIQIYIFRFLGQLMSFFNQFLQRTMRGLWTWKCQYFCHMPPILTYSFPTCQDDRGQDEWFIIGFPSICVKINPIIMIIMMMIIMIGRRKLSL